SILTDNGGVENGPDRRLSALRLADLPNKTLSFWKLAGPGAVLVGLSIGAGEIIVWPRIVAEYGATMVWAAMVGVLAQLVVNIEVGRYTLATGESAYTGLCRIWRGFAPIFIFLNVAAWLLPGWARASGGALKALLVGPSGWGDPWVWTAITFAAVALLLFGPKIVYNTVERVIFVLISIMMVGLILVALVVGNAETCRELGRGLLNVGFRDPDFSVKALFSAIVFAGAGGTANLFFCYYLRDKNIGMGARVPEIMSVLRGKVEKEPTTGYTFADTNENRTRWLAWFAHMRNDQLLFFWAANTVTMLLFIFGALAVLHPQRIVPSEDRLIWDQAIILGQVWGQTGRVVFLLVGVATLFSTQLAIVDGCARSVSDILYVNFRWAQRRSLSYWYAMIAGFWIIGGCVLTYFLQRLENITFLFNAGFMGGIAMAIYVPFTLYMNRKLLPKTAQPSSVATLLLALVAVLYVSFAIFSIGDMITNWGAF
ncbi:MAG: Nramp family divalent metal transporter, partial [Candidatus Zipacnadales bacterium]